MLECARVCVCKSRGRAGMMSHLQSVSHFCERGFYSLLCVSVMAASLRLSHLDPNTADVFVARAT